MINKSEIITAPFTVEKAIADVAPTSAKKMKNRPATALKGKNKLRLVKSPGVNMGLDELEHVNDSILD